MKRLLVAVAASLGLGASGSAARAVPIDFQTGNGEVVITELIPEPASIVLLGAGLIGLAAVWRCRRLNG